jgi:hypothetical protein
MDTAFAKIVTDLDGRYHMLIGGQIVSLKTASDDANNEMVEGLVTALRRDHSGLTGNTGAAQAVAATS